MDQDDKAQIRARHAQELQHLYGICEQIVNENIYPEQRSAALLRLSAIAHRYTALTGDHSLAHAARRYNDATTT